MKNIYTTFALAFLAALASCTDGNPAEFTGPDPIGIWRYQVAQVAYKGGPGLVYTACSGVDGQLKLKSNGTWSEWRSIDATYFPIAGTYSISEGVITFLRSDGRLFETAAFSISDDGSGKHMILKIDNPAFKATCGLSKE